MYYNSNMVFFPLSHEGNIWLLSCLMFCSVLFQFVITLSACCLMLGRWCTLGLSELFRWYSCPLCLEIRLMREVWINLNSKVAGCTTLHSLELRWVIFLCRIILLWKPLHYILYCYSIYLCGLALKDSLNIYKKPGWQSVPRLLSDGLPSISNSILDQIYLSLLTSYVIQAFKVAAITPV